MAKPHGLTQQISSLNVLKAGLAAPAITAVEYYDNMTTFHMEVLNEAIATLEFMRAHEQTIRDAIRAARELDAVAER
jgi:energy-converting hydrogenase Eha subunit C